MIDCVHTHSTLVGNILLKDHSKTFLCYFVTVKKGSSIWYECV